MPDERPRFSDQDLNMGIFDGAVAHAEVNQAIARADKAILFGEQTRLPYFPDDLRLPRLHAGDPLVLLFWKVLKKIPGQLREALLDAPISITLVRGGSLLFFDHFRRHQAVHIGCRRRTLYLPETLLAAAEEKGYDYWAIAEGLIYAGWMLLDYLLLVDVIRAYAGRVGKFPGYRLGERELLVLAEKYSRHRRTHPEEGRSEIREFVEGYRTRLAALGPNQVSGGDSFELAREIFDPALEQEWARDKMERIAQVFNFPRLFLFDRDIIHGVARELALAEGQAVEPRSFEDVLHDYRDALRFEPRPLMTTLGRSVMPRPRARFLQQVVALGEEGLRGFFEAYRAGDPEVRDLMHPLWMHLCSLSSDPAGVFSRVGRCRALGREGLDGSMDRLLAGILVRLDKAPNYAEMTSQVVRMGEAAGRELVELVERQRLVEEDEWEVFKVRKQVIVSRACELLGEMSGRGWRKERKPRVDLHRDERIQGLLADRPHRLTSDPSGLLMYLRAYRRTVEEFGTEDPDADFLLASVLIRMDRCEEYGWLVEQVEQLGEPVFSAVHGIFEQISERDERRSEILRQARLLWRRMMVRHRSARGGEQGA